MMPRVSTTATVVTMGWFVTSPTQRVAKLRRGSAVALRFFTRRGRPATRPLRTPSIAGVRLSATSTAIATATAAAMPIVVRNGMPAKESPMRAMSTVTPANTTADPAVPVARAADSSGATPERTWS